MIEILLVLLVFLASKKRTSRKRFSPANFRKVQSNFSSGVGTLASLVAAVVSVSNAMTTECRASRLKGTILWNDATSGDVISVGIAHSDYTAPEIEEWIESTGGVDFGNLIDGEVSRRLIRHIGSMIAPDEPKLRFNIKLNWLLDEGDNLNIWLYNRGPDPMNTGSELVFMGEMNLFRA